MRRYRSSAALAGRAALAGLGLLALACAGPENDAQSARSAEKPPATGLRLAKAAVFDLPTKLEAVGSVEAIRRASPGSKLLGRVDQILVREGEAVKSGQVLARLDSRDLQAAIAQAQAAITMAEAQHLNAAAMAQRMRQLRERGSATPKNLEDAVAGEAVAAAAIAQAKANLQAATAIATYAEIRSPFAGWLVARFIEEGDLAAPGQPMFVVEDLRQVKVKAQIAELDVAKLKNGQPASVRIDGDPREFAGRLERLIPAADPMARSFEAQIVLDNADANLRSGLFARVRLETAESHPVLKVPTSAVREQGQLRLLFVTAGDRVVLRYVKTGRELDGDLEIQSGLDAGESYVVNPPATLQDQQRFVQEAN